jgi:hypothetical protein
MLSQNAATPAEQGEPEVRADSHELSLSQVAALNKSLKWIGARYRGSGPCVKLCNSIVRHPRTHMNDLAKHSNQIEAVIWFAVAVFLSMQALRSQRRLRRVFSLLSGAFFLFGISDLIEAHTGAWWRPVWLLLFKSGCVVAFLYGFREYYKIRKSPDA